ncbi:MAG TPA: peptidoglycan editing factor PgeF [Bryobacteraceae bacterium]|nr:peptidoglycan editing factor PgeF [Bryobacteraceae bacterium]
MPGFYRDSRNVYRCEAMAALPWLEHGFGTRHSEAWTPGESLVRLKQIHSDVVVTADGEPGCIGAADGMISTHAGLMLTIRTADCVPVLVVDPVRRAVAAVHAGWRGTAAMIVPKAVARMVVQFGTSPLDLMVAIGPSIRSCCYEVGAEVAAKFTRWTGTSAWLDLVAVNAAQLEALRIPQDQIHRIGLCTKCGEGEFHSFRRDGVEAGRMDSSIGIRSL